MAIKQFDAYTGNPVKTIECMDTIESNLDNIFDSIKWDIIKKWTLNDEEKTSYKEKIDEAITNTMDHESTGIYLWNEITMKDIILWTEIGTNHQGWKNPYAILPEDPRAGWENIKIPLSRWSKLAWLLQIYLELSEETVQFKDQQNFNTRIDKKIGEDTIKAINDYKTKQALERIAQEPYIQWVESIGDSLHIDIELTKWNILEVRGENSMSTINLNNGEITIYVWNGKSLIYPAWLYFSRKNRKINFPNNTNNNNTLEQWIQIANFFNKQIETYINKKALWDIQEPYQESLIPAGIEINNGIFDTTILLMEELHKFRWNHHTWKSYKDIQWKEIDKKTYIDFLNNLYTLQNHKDPQYHPSHTWKSL